MADGRPLRKSQAEDESKGGHNTVAGGGVRIRAGSRPCEVRVQQGRRIIPIAGAGAEATAAEPAIVCAATADLGVERMIADVHHAMGHPGIRRTLYFARRTDPTVSKRQVRQVISGCEPCKSLDPAPGKWKGSLEVEEVWQRVGMDITHVRGRPYMTLIDCGPSRFAVWRRLRVHCSANVTEQLEAVFYERGPRNRRLGPLTLVELQIAENYWIRQAQRECFANEIQQLLNGKRITSNSQLIHLDPFLDENGLMRINGRL
ncbi:conserved hypothetical protein [Trichinella spiralis]|uniref:hypothetical protein n=1 Tax=Trichinella spiralis TaxID=6334 RepID=UPI0001EFD1B8|nr:conserved hypothetical protein [Trichinella spiralis]